MPRHIPIEIYPFIFHHVTSKAELSNLCMVSRAFRYEAQRILYHTVRLSNDCYCIISWCHAVLENPTLAMHVYSLSLPTAFINTFRVAYEVKSRELRHVVKRALSSLLKLVELYTSFSPLGVLYLDSDIFCGHPFHLQISEESLDSPCALNHWLKFLSEQPGIRRRTLTKAMPWTQTSSHRLRLLVRTQHLCPLSHAPCSAGHEMFLG
jgi:hypothetical protein